MIVYTNGAILVSLFLSLKAAKFLKKKKLDFLKKNKNKIVPEVIYLINMYVHLHSTPKFLICMYETNIHEILINISS